MFYEINVEISSKPMVSRRASVTESVKSANGRKNISHVLLYLEEWRWSWNHRNPFSCHTKLSLLLIKLFHTGKNSGDIQVLIFIYQPVRHVRNCSSGKKTVVKCEHSCNNISLRISTDIKDHFNLFWEDIQRLVTFLIYYQLLIFILYSDLKNIIPERYFFENL